LEGCDWCYNQFENIVERLHRKEILIMKKSESKQEKLEEKEAIKNWNP
jgi:predicted amidophosphoribosyltransferase